MISEDFESIEVVSSVEMELFSEFSEELCVEFFELCETFERFTLTENADEWLLLGFCSSRCKLEPLSLV